MNKSTVLKTKRKFYKTCRASRNVLVQVFEALNKKKEIQTDDVYSTLGVQKKIYDGYWDL